MAFAHHHDHLRAEQPLRHLIDAGDAPAEVQNAAGDLQRQAEPDQFLQRVPWRQAHADEIADEIGEACGGEPGAIFGASPAHLRHHDVRSAPCEDENDLRGQHLAQRVADEGAAGEEAADIAAKSAAFSAHAARFRQRKRDGECSEQCHAGDDVEDRAPAESRFDQTAGERRQHLRDHHDRDHEADHCADPLALIKITDDGAADHHAGGAAERLQEPRRDQLRQALREHAGHARRNHQAKSREQHGAPPEPVRERPHEDLRAGDADHVERHRHLRGRDAAAERRRQHR